MTRPTTRPRTRPTTTAELALTAFLGVIALGVAGAVVGLLLPRFPGRDELLATIAMLAGYTIAAGVVAVAFRPRSRTLMWLCVTPLVLSFLLWQVLLWFESTIGYPRTTQLAKSAGTCMILAGVLLFDGLIRLPTIRGMSVGVLRVAGTITAALAGLLLTGALWFDPLEEEITFKAVGVLTALAIGALFTVFVLAGIAKLREARAGDSALSALAVPVRLTCPRCAHACEVHANRPERCAHCNLRLTVQVDEPRCVCGYLLYQLQGNTCPECGRAVPESERWPATADLEPADPHQADTEAGPVRP